MLTKRIIPCLDVKDGRVVKGVNFVNIRDAGDPSELARYYCEQGADELVFLDITATNEKRRTIIDVVERTAKEISIPHTVGGGIRTLDDFNDVLNAGADKVSVNSAAVRDETLISRAAERFGSNRVVVAIDAHRADNGSFEVLINGGRIAAGIDAAEWAMRCEKLGAGEILLTSMDMDGTKRGFDIPLTRLVTDSVNIPVVMSGGCGSLEDFYIGFTEGGGDAALAASLFHYGELTIPQVKQYLKERGIPVR